MSPLPIVFRTDDDDLPPLPESWSTIRAVAASSSTEPAAERTAMDKEIPSAPAEQSRPFAPGEDIAAAATLEAATLLKEKPFLTITQAASMAARRAGLVRITKAAMRAVLLSGDAVVSHIPTKVAAAVDGCDPAACNEEQVLRLSAWLKASPWELRKAKSPRTAMQAASQAFGTARLDETAINATANEVVARLSARTSTPPLRVVGSLTLRDATLPLDTVQEAALSALPEEMRVAVAVNVSIKRGADLFVTLTLPRSGSGAASGDDATLCACAERAMEAAFAAAATAESGAAERTEVRRVAAAEWREEVAAWRATRAAHRRVAREAAEAEAAWEASEPAYQGEAPSGRQGKNKPPRRRAAVSVEGRDMSRCARPGVDGRVLRRRGRAAACERRRSRLDKGRC